MNRFLLLIFLICYSGCDTDEPVPIEPLGEQHFETESTIDKNRSNKVKTKSNPQNEKRPKASRMNDLAKSKSPYLLQHADNPVNWVEWGEAAFERASKEGKPILLSVGYSTCHWCHVMAHESFEDETVAKFINDHFIAIKVDREERPDVDRIYMTYVQSTTGHGGWPMTVFLTPERIPFYGGTYFPKERFLDLLMTVNKLWGTKRDEFTGIGQQFVEFLQQQVAETKDETEIELQSDWLLKNAVQQLNLQYDETYAGFGGAPKFPRPVIFAPLVTYARLFPDDPLAKRAMQQTVSTLRAMANGGMYDHIGGGFHRYSVDKYWHVPHFEKMMYDQGQLATLYADLGLLLNDEQFISVAEDICNYVQKRMTAPGGGLYSAEDADSLTEADGHESKEGAYYLWKYSELVELLGEEEAKLCAAYYQSSEAGNVRPESDPHREFVGLNVFARVADVAALAKEFDSTPKSLDEKVTRWRKKLYDARIKRPKPHLDDKILVAWNGLMISGFVHTYIATGKKTYLESAENAVNAIRELCWDDRENILYRIFREERGSVHGFADDYAMLIQSLIDLHEANGSAFALRWADELQQVFNKRFARKTGGWYETDGADRLLLSRMQEAYEGAEPGANSVSIRNCLRLASLLGNEEYAGQVQRTLARYAGNMNQQPQALPAMISTASVWDQNVPSVVIVDGNNAEELRKVFHEIAVPGSTLLTINEQTRDYLQAPWLVAMKNRHGNAQAFLCEGKSCQAPTTDASVLRLQLQNAMKRLQRPAQKD